MKFFSSRFGEIEYNPTNVVYFPFGIPGFDKFKRYVILSKKNIPYFYFLHSIEVENLMFILTNPFIFLPDYNFKLSDGDLYILEIEDSSKFGKDVFVFSIVTINNEEKKFSLNLKAPIIINLEKKIGKQVILYENDYPIKYELDFNKKKEQPHLDLSYSIP